MTRINLIPVEELTDKHLVAEYRELPRIYALSVSHYVRFGANWSSIPSQYVLGKGHMKFFINKLLFLNRRHRLLIAEMLRRGFKPNFDGSIPSSALALPKGFFQDYIPNQEAVAISRARIEDRIKNPRKAHLQAKKKAL